MTKQKIFCIDLDGTLLTKRMKITKKTLVAIDRYIKDGGTPIIATGRSYVSAQKYVSIIEGFTNQKMKYLIAFNGAYIIDFEQNKTVEKLISEENTKALYDLAEENNCGIWIYPSEKENNRFIYTNKSLTKIFALHQRELKLKKYKETNKLSSFKINIMSFKKHMLKKIYNILIQKYNEVFEISFTCPMLIEITAKGATKGFSLQNIINKMRIRKDEVSAIGDSGNDVSMFEVAGTSYCLKTWSQKARNVATFYFHNKKNIVANIIEKYLNQPKIELVCSDLDGTLLKNKSKLMTHKTKKIIKKMLYTTNCNFAIVTGRGIEDCLVVYSYLHLSTPKNTYIIGCNGSFIYECATEKYLINYFMDLNIAKQIFDIFINFKNTTNNCQVGLMMHCQDTSTGEKPLVLVNNWLLMEKIFLKKSKKFLTNSWAKKNIIEINSMNEQHKIYKIVIYFENKEGGETIQSQIKMQNIPVDIYTSGISNMEIMPHGIDKGSGVDFLRKSLNIEKDKVVVVGDEENDIPMLKKYEHSYTLQSSNEKVRSSAKNTLDEKPSKIVFRIIKNDVLVNEHK